MAKATGNRKKLDANKDGKISAEDFAMLRKKKGKTMKKTKNGTKKKMMYGGTMKKKMNMGGGLKKTKKMARGGVKAKKMSRGGPVRRK
tara:strand:+ start:329 stop:592 length:264 start_codon:yes stop_codon:yes gene_type:complete